MSVAEVASALRLKRVTIDALEADRFEVLPAPIFIRGYLRGYARVVGVPPEPLVDLYDRYGFAPPPIAPETNEVQQAHTSDIAVRIVTYAVGAGLILLVVLWWQSQDLGALSNELFGSLTDAIEDSTAPSAESSAAASDDVDGVDGTTVRSGIPEEVPGDSATPASTDEEATATPEEVPGDSATPASTDEEATATPGEETADDSADEPDPEGEAGTESGAGSDPAGREGEATAPTDAPGGRDALSPRATTTPTGADPPTSPAQRRDPGSGAPAPAVASSSQSVLVLEFVHESWVEVYDRERTRLYFGLVPPGRTVDFTGAPPFDILLGFAKDARVTLDGDVFDHTPHVRHGVARFRIGASTDPDTDAAPSVGRNAAEEPRPSGAGP